MDLAFPQTKYNDWNMSFRGDIFLAKVTIRHNIPPISCLYLCGGWIENRCCADATSAGKGYFPLFTCTVRSYGYFPNSMPVEMLRTRYPTLEEALQRIFDEDSDDDEQNETDIVVLPPETTEAIVMKRMEMIIFWIMIMMLYSTMLLVKLNCM